MKRFALVFALLLGLSGGQAKADFILRSATYGGPAAGGYDVNGNQFLGARFSLTTTTAIDHVGGNIGENQAGGLFAAIISLSGPNALPSGTPSTFTPLAFTVFTTTSTSSEILVPLAVTLGPGDYALVFGTGRFGAIGTGFMAANNTDTAQASYFYSNTTNWFNSGFTRAEFIVTGAPVTQTVTAPAPSGLLLAGIGGVFSLLGYRLRQRKAVVTGVATA